MDSCVKAQGVPLICASATRVGWTAKSQFEKVGENSDAAKSRSAGGNGAGLDVYL